jgi:hypothetical protein
MLAPALEFYPCLFF